MTSLTVARRARNLKRTFGVGILPSQDEIDNAWFLGLDLGRKGIEGAPNRLWAAEVKAAFAGGYAEGEVTRAADDETEYAAELAALAACNSREGRWLR